MAAVASSALATARDPLFLAAVLLVAVVLGAQRWRARNAATHFFIRLGVFVVVTGLMLAGGVAPYRPEAVAGGAPRHLIVRGIEVVWWLTAAWLATGALRAFVVLGRRPRESKLIEDLLAGLIYVTALFAIVAYVFDLPLKGLLATSGVLAIVIGLALQNSLGDVFSGIVLDIERPYRVGDWIILDDEVQGEVIESNWRATHILTARRDVAIVPNSVVAKSKLVNCSSPTKTHGVSLHVKLDPALAPAAARNLLLEALLGSPHVLQTPAPSVTVTDLSAEMIDLELSYTVADRSAAALVQNEVFDRVHQAVAATGARFARRLAGVAGGEAPKDRATVGGPERLLAGVSLFATLTPEEKAQLASRLQRKTYEPGEVIVETGTVMQSLCIVASGVLVASVDDEGRRAEVGRLARGSWFGELGLLAGEPINVELAAMTRVVIYAISKEALSPLLAARPKMVEELSESLTQRRSAHRAMLDRVHPPAPHEEGLADRVTATIRRLFAIH